MGKVKDCVYVKICRLLLTYIHTHAYIRTQGGGTVSVLLGRGDGTFTNGFVFPTGLVGGGPVDLALGDFNGDGILDLALALAKCDTLTILWGDGFGAFIRPVKIVLGVHKGFPLSILAVDLDLNGFADLVVGLSCAEKNLAVLMSLGDGTFRPPHFIDLGCKTKPVQIVTCLFNLDLFPDIAIANGALSNSVSVLLGRGDGTFRRPREWSVAPGLAPMALAVGDFDKDHHCDLCTANALSNDVTVLRGKLFERREEGERRRKKWEQGYISQRWLRFSNIQY